MNKFNFKTGDLLLFDYKRYRGLGIISYFIKKFTHSNYSHVGMILKDPDFIDPPLQGYYLWHSDWDQIPDPQDNRIKFGVQIVPLDDIFELYKEAKSSIFLRRIHCNDGSFTNEKLRDIHKVVYNKPYDTRFKDWFWALWREDKEPQKTDRFWCSALVGYIYTMCGILESDTDWSILRPSDFSIKYNGELVFMNNCYLEDEEIEVI